MSINPKETAVLVQGTSAYPMILLDSTLLELVDEFCYIGSIVTNNLSLNTVIHVGKSATKFGKLG